MRSLAVLVLALMMAAMASGPVRAATARRRHLAAVRAHRVYVRRHRVVRVARHQLGTPYRWGGTSPRTGFDCSGLVQWAYRVALRRFIPRTTWGQMTRGLPIPRWDLLPGDIVFFFGGEHEALYIGGGRVIQAPHTGTRVQVSRLSAIGGFYTARRYVR